MINISTSFYFSGNLRENEEYKENLILFLLVPHEQNCFISSGQLNLDKTTERTDELMVTIGV